MDAGNLNRLSAMNALRSCGYNPQRIGAARWHTVPSWQIVFEEKIKLAEQTDWQQKIILPSPGMYIVNVHTATKDFHSTVISIIE